MLKKTSGYDGQIASLGARVDKFDSVFGSVAEYDKSMADVEKKIAVLESKNANYLLWAAFAVQFLFILIVAFLQFISRRANCKN